MHFSQKIDGSYERTKNLGVRGDDKNAPSEIISTHYVGALSMKDAHFSSFSLNWRVILSI